MSSIPATEATCGDDATAPVESVATAQAPAPSSKHEDADDKSKSPAVSPHRSKPGTGAFPVDGSGSGSPDKTKLNSPTKQLLHGVDISSSSLAAISARLMPYVTPAELEIARLNRDAAAAAKSARPGRISGDQSNDAAHSDGVGTSATHIDHQQSPSSPSKSTAMGSALHDSMIAEEWVNLHLETSGAFLVPASDIEALLQRPDVRGATSEDPIEDDDEVFGFRRRGGESGPLARAGIDRWTLYRLGMPKDLVDRVYRALYVYTNGFHNIINEIASHCPPSVEKHVSSNVWLTFLLLLEQCENGKYEMAMLKFKQATQDWRQQMQEEFMNEKLRLDAHVHGLESQLQDELTRSATKSELISKLATDASAASASMADMQLTIADLAEQLRVLKLDILVHEDVEKNLDAQIDDARKDFEVANSERFNALTEKFTLEEESRKLQSELERIESEKATYAKRMHETLFMNQALRATCETLKHNVVVLNMDKEKLEHDKLTAQDHVERVQRDLQDTNLAKASIEHDLVDSTRRQAHLEERLHAMKAQLDAEMEHTTRYVQEIARLGAEIDEGKVQVGVLEAKCNLLTAEKQNTGMRAQDKLRIERLLNQKLELENQIENMKLERTKDQEQIWNLRASLEALDSELQQTKRVFSAGQQAFLHSERTAEQLRHQLQEVEKNYEKSSKNLTSLRERFKMFEESSKEQVTKLEVELNVTSSQLREVTYVNRDNAATITALTKTLDVAEKDAKTRQQQLEAAQKQHEMLLNEKEDLQRDQQQRDLQSSSSKQTISKFLRELQNILALVKMDEYPMDEALRELLRMVKDAFGRELDLEKVLDDEDEPLDFEEEYDEDELQEEERERMARMASRRTGFSVGLNGELASIETESGSVRLPSSALGELDADGKRRLTKVSRMSKFRRSKLDTQVRKLQREIENKTDLVRSLEGVVCSQADEIAMLTATSEQQMRWLKLSENRRGMLHADIDGLLVVLAEARGSRKKTDALLQDAKIDLVIEVNKTFQVQLALQSLRRQYDMQNMAGEDLLSTIGRAYEYELYMKSLRRDEAVQATATMAEQFTQTLVPQRNPVLDRVRVPAMNLPAMNPTSVQAISMIQKINDTAKALLANGANVAMGTGELQLQPSESRLPPYQQQPRPHATRPRQRQQQQQQPSHTARSGGQRHRHRHLMMATDPGATQSAAARTAPQPQLVRHYNEFGMRQDVLVSPVYPPYFPSQLPTTSVSTTGKRMPRKPHRRPHQHLQFNGDDRSDAAGWDARVGAVAPSAIHGQHQQTIDASGGGGGGLRYHRGFLRTGMEVLRGGGGVDGQQLDDEYEEEEEEDDDENDNRGEERRWRHGSRGLLSSPSKLELAVRDYHDEQDLTRPRHSPSRYYSHRLRDDESRKAVPANSDDGDEEDDEEEEEEEEEEEDYDDDDRALAQDTRHSRFVPAGVLYPMLPPR